MILFPYRHVHDPPDSQNAVCSSISRLVIVDSLALPQRQDSTRCRFNFCAVHCLLSRPFLVSVQLSDHLGPVSLSPLCRSLCIPV
jgi:hypothetical protein